MGAPAVRKASQAVARASKAEAALGDALSKLSSLQRRVTHAEAHAAAFVLPDGDAAEATTADRLKVRVGTVGIRKRMCTQRQACDGVGVAMCGGVI
jgi:hypothetical protein